jgi:hypothetical protein
MRDASPAIRARFWARTTALAGRGGALSGALAYGRTRDEAVARVEALALRILAERLEHGEPRLDTKSHLRRILRTRLARSAAWNRAQHRTLWALSSRCWRLG